MMYSRYLYHIGHIDWGFDAVEGFLGKDWIVYEDTDQKIFNNPSFVCYRPLTLLEFKNKIDSDPKFSVTELNKKLLKNK